jgi:DNA-binding NtrC family response regulator
VNCSALPANLIESELFGHERGAFTDAHAAKPGLFEVADGGTLFLDEIDMLPVELQAKLLRVPEDKEVRRVGATKSRTVDVRIIAATHQNLREAVAAGKFREDLYFRLSVITLALPPLRERGEDVILIALELLQRLAGQHGVPVPTLSVEARRALKAHAWPGNVRELKNAVERALLLSPPGELSISELVPETAAAERGNGKFELPESLDELATTAARAMLERCGGNRSEAARRLSISRRRLRRLVSGEAAVES